MKKWLILTAVLLGLSAGAPAQVFKGPGENTVSLGISNGMNAWDNFGLQANYAVGVQRFISLGAQANFDFGRFTQFYIGPRVNFHIWQLLFPKSKAYFDVYVSGTLGVKFKEGAKFDGGGYAGFQWNFAPRSGLRLEVGSNIMLGYAFSF